MIESRLVREGTTLALSALRHARATAAMVAVLAAPLVAEEDGPPALVALHPAIDVAAWRWRDPPATTALAAADLAGLGQVLVGRGRRQMPVPESPIPVSLRPAEDRRRTVAAAGMPGCDIAGALARAAAAARRMGGLPAGAVLVAAGLSPALAPQPETDLAARLGPIGRTIARFA
jgi:2-keto-4-pentenoate hydratase